MDEEEKKPPKELVDRLGLEGAEEFMENYYKLIENLKKIDKAMVDLDNEMYRIDTECRQNLKAIDEKYNKIRNKRTIKSILVFIGLNIIGFGFIIGPGVISELRKK